MTRRTAILCLLLLAVGSIALWRRGPRGAPVSPKQEAEAEAAARRFMVLRESEQAADRGAWKATEPAVRIEQEVVRGVERAMASGRLDEGGLPGLAARISAPEGHSLRWMQARVMGVGPVPEAGGGPPAFLARLETEVVLDKADPRSASRVVWTARFIVESVWVEGTEIPRLRDYRLVEAPTVLAGTPVFEPWADLLIPTNGVGLFTDPLILELTEQGMRLHLAGAGVAAVRAGEGWRWEQADVGPPEPVKAVVRADLDGDGSVELVVADASGLRVRGRDGWAQAWVAPAKLRHPQSITAGDIDGDGDLDLWITQYRLPFVQGQFPTPYYDGNGRFSDLTAELGLTRHAFGMAHAVWDANGDGLPDLLMVGMDSPVASQLDHAGLGRAEFPAHTAHRAAMTYGNRLFMGSTVRGLEFSPVSEGLRRAGWAWGAAVLDWNNDGQDDLYLVNGHETFENRSDFERQFWQHDIYVGGSAPDPARRLYFMQANEARRAARQSYGGWQANRLFTRRGPDSFTENAWVLGVAVTEDCRNVVAGDFDGDGRMDLALTTYEQWPVARQRLRVLRNRSAAPAHWIGFNLDVPAPGSRVELTTPDGVRRHWWVNGDGYRSQSDVQAHFGLGARAEVIRAEWVRADGSRVDLPRVADRWHRIPARR